MQKVFFLIFCLVSILSVSIIDASPWHAAGNKQELTAVFEETTPSGYDTRQKQSLDEQQTSIPRGNEYGLDAAEWITDEQTGESVNGLKGRGDQNGGGYKTDDGYENNNNNQNRGVIQDPDDNVGRGDNQDNGSDGGLDGADGGNQTESGYKSNNKNVLDEEDRGKARRRSRKPSKKDKKNQGEWSYQPDGYESGFGHEITDEELYGVSYGRHHKSRDGHDSRQNTSSDSSDEGDTEEDIRLDPNCPRCRHKTYNIGNGHGNKNVVRIFKD